MDKRRLARLVIESLVVVALLATSIIGPGVIGVASAHGLPQPQSSVASLPVTSGGSLAATQTLPSLAVGPWEAPHSEIDAPFYGPADAGTPAASQKRKPGEQPDLRTQTSDTYLNADGTWTRKSFPVPINYQDAASQWQPIDSTIDADSSDAGYAFGNRANGWHVHFAAQAGGHALVHARFPGVEVAETLDGAARVPATTQGGLFPN